jgi:pyruvate dehydrogenase complex dehydrogenase (E1) component
VRWNAAVALRRDSETDAARIVVAVLWGLFLHGDLKADTVHDAARRYDVDPDPRDRHDS